MASKKPLVYIFMGSDSDLPVIKECVAVLNVFKVPCELKVVSAHRSPERAAGLAREAEDKGVKVIIAAAGLAAHLAGVVASHTTLPVIGVPLSAGNLGGLDSLLSTVQMPAGIPVATVAIGKAGAKNAALLAVQILALSDQGLSSRLKKYRKELALQVEAKSKEIEQA